MRILVNDYAGHPFQLELSRHIASLGHEVAHLYCSSNSTPHGDLHRTGPPRFSVIPISTGDSFEKYSLGKRSLDELTYGHKCAQFQRLWNPDVALYANVPMASLRLIQVRNRNTPAVLWLQDIQSGIASLALTGWKASLRPLLTRLERSTIRSSDQVVAIAESLAAEAKAIGLDADAVTVIENWAPINDIPVLDRINPWSLRHGLDDKFVFLYSGTLGMKHRPQLLADLAESFLDDSAVRVVVASAGLGATWLESARVERALTNLVLLPFQEFSDLPQMLASADVHLAVLEQEAGSYSIPSKILSHLCSARPVLGFLPPSNSSTRLIATRAQAGITTSCDQAFLSGAKELRRDRSRRLKMGAAGRQYAEANFDIYQIAQEFFEVFVKATGRLSNLEEQSLSTEIPEEHSALAARSIHNGQEITEVTQ